MNKKIIIIATIAILLIASGLIIYFFFFSNSIVYIGQQEEVSSINEDELKNNNYTTYECTKSLDYSDILIGDLDIEEDTTDNEEEVDEVEDEDEDEDDSNEIQSYKISDYQINTTVANVGKVKKDIKLIIMYNEKQIEMYGEINLKFDNKEGYDKYFIGKYSENDDLKTNEEELTKTLNYHIEKTFSGVTSENSSNENFIEVYKNQNYNCVLKQ